MRTDLHTHTTASDGVLAPAALVALAKAAGVGLLAVTDHDTVDGLAEAAEAARRLGVALVAGIELSSTVALPPPAHAPEAAPVVAEVHLLGLGVDPGHGPLRDHTAALRLARAERAAAIVARLNDLGVPVTLDAVERRAAGGVLARPHLAAEVVAVGAAADVGEAFARYLRDGGPADLPKPSLPTAREAIRLVHDAGGLAVAAHPALLPSDDVLDVLVRAGLDGIEVRHPTHGPISERAYREEARRFGLCRTGGSDYHGLRADDGARLGAYGLDPSDLPDLRRLA